MAFWCQRSWRDSNDVTQTGALNSHLYRHRVYQKFLFCVCIPTTFRILFWIAHAPCVISLFICLYFGKKYYLWFVIGGQHWWVYTVPDNLSVYLLVGVLLVCYMTNKFFFFFFFFSNVRSFLRSSRSLDIISIAIFDRPDQISHQVHWHCWLSVRKSIWSVKIEWLGVGVVICHERRADCLHIVQLMPLHSKTPLSLLALFKSRLVVSFWYRQPTYRGCPGKEAVRRV